ncbi:MAG: hypothetical protein RIT45_3575 [Pseudomonadota bacterium]|jgi:hypothetical protein
MTARTNRPSDMELFALYHLGLDREGQYAFRNAHQCARHLRVEVATFEQWLRDARLDTDAVKRVDFNLSVAHVDAQFVSRDEVGRFVADTWRRFEAARTGQPLEQIRLDLDYEDIWGVLGGASIEDAEPGEDGGVEA